MIRSVNIKRRPTNYQIKLLNDFFGIIFKKLWGTYSLYLIKKKKAHNVQYLDNVLGNYDVMGF